MCARTSRLLHLAAKARRLFLAGVEDVIFDEGESTLLSFYFCWVGLFICLFVAATAAAAVWFDAHIQTHMRSHAHVHTMYVRTYIHPSTHAHMHAHMHACMHACIHTYIHAAYVRAYVGIYMHMHMHTCARARVLCVYVCTCVCVCVCVYVCCVCYVCILVYMYVSVICILDFDQGPKRLPTLACHGAVRFCMFCAASRCRSARRNASLLRLWFVHAAMARVCRWELAAPKWLRAIGLLPRAVAWPSTITNLWLQCLPSKGTGLLC